jgi:hypothetical protein
MTTWIKILTSFGSIMSIGFGIWHFFVPKIWNWYAYIDKTATELVLAVQAINIFFSLSLVLLRIANLLLVFKNPQERFSLILMLSVSTILWTNHLSARFSQSSPSIQYAFHLYLGMGLFCPFIVSSMD